MRAVRPCAVTLAGEPELASAASVLGTPIAVYQGAPPHGIQLVARYDPEGVHKAAGRRPINLLFHRLGHYDLLLPSSPGGASRL